jgi:hypothetical protein
VVAAFGFLPVYPSYFTIFIPQEGFSMTLKKRDYILLALAVALVLFLLAAPPKTTKMLPFDQVHKKLYKVVQTKGEMAAEKECETCHNPQGVALPKNHPPKYRCLLCHQLNKKYVK